MKKIKTEIVVVIPVGPGSVPEFVLDTVQSFIFYTRAEHRFLLADDSGDETGRIIAQQIPGSFLLVNKKPMGGWAGLYITLAAAYRFALENYEFKAILKLDTDALIIGPEPEKEALELFCANSRAGIAGQYPLTYSGEAWNTRWPAQRIHNSTRSWKFIRRPVANFKLSGLYNRALQNGYRTGESVFGGAYFIGRACLAALLRSGVLPDRSFRRLNLGEDHLFSLLAKAAGYSLESLSGDGPMACEWKGLPASPEDLYRQRKKIIHSVTCWQAMDEAAIRDYFRIKRMEDE